MCKVLLPPQNWRCRAGILASFLCTVRNQRFQSVILSCIYNPNTHWHVRIRISGTRHAQSLRYVMNTKLTISGKYAFSRCSIVQFQNGRVNTYRVQNKPPNFNTELVLGYKLQPTQLKYYTLSILDSNCCHTYNMSIRQSVVTRVPWIRLPYI